jgi:hypothetical protein
LGAGYRLGGGVRSTEILPALYHGWAVMLANIILFAVLFQILL